MSRGNGYFQQLNDTLKRHHRSIPFLVLDLNRLDQNISTLKQHLNPSTKFRIVVKSLPSIELLEYIMQKANSQDLMVFHQPFLTDLSSRLDSQSDVLLGKPMPIKTAQFYYHNLPQNASGFNAYQQIQWLVDTEKRIQEYIGLAKQLGQPLRLNVEIDVGLHRGGFRNLSDLKKGLQLIAGNQNWVKLSGLMGYDPHVVKLPRILRSQHKALRLANTFYHQCIALIKEEFPTLWTTDLTLNGAGSPTLNLHEHTDSPLNDISAGSCLVKPTTFDIPSLSDYIPACYIATPVLKQFTNTTLPALESMSSLLNLISSSNRRSYFIYGGFWKADYCFPEGIKANNLFGPSTNQTMLNAPADTSLKVDDYVFLRPHQSEFVFLQFGNILVIRDSEIVSEWELLKNC